MLRTILNTNGEDQVPEGFGKERVDQVAYWNGAVGERWARLQGALDDAFAELTAAALAAADPRPGEAVLDIGCGTGATVLALARRVGPSGSVLGVDISRPMLAVATERLRRAGEDRGRVLVADAGQPVPGGPFDLAFSRFGVMFFDYPVDALTTIRDGLAPDGRLAFACWQPFAANPWFKVPTEALLALLPSAPTPTDPDAPGPFAFADPQRVRSVLRQAGFGTVAIEPVTASVPLGVVSDAVVMLSEVGPASRAMAEASADARPKLADGLRTALAPHAGPDGVVRLGGAIWVVTARRDP